MKKYFFYALCIALLSTITVAAQNDQQFSKPGTKIFKVNNPATEKNDLFEITGLGSTTFTASNTADGSANSYKHSLQIVVVLVPATKTGNTNFQLNFYSSTENVQQAATYENGALNIYYPVEVYEDIRNRLEQAFAARKKVTVKVIQKPDGYRQGTLVL